MVTMGLRDAIRALLDGDETDDTGEISEIEQGVADAVGDEGTGDGEGDEDAADDGEGIGEADLADEDGGDVEGTPGDEVESPEVAELRQQLVDLAAENETLRNRLAAAGIEDDVEPEIVEGDEDAEDTDEEEVVAAFDSDYAEREAALAEIKKDN
jgi:hypothetical protein